MDNPLRGVFEIIFTMDINIISHDISATEGFMGSRNFFELSIALLPLNQRVVLLTFVGVLVEVSVIILVKIVNKTRPHFDFNVKKQNL